ncbi:MAG: STN domain-containing protein [Elusimicrobiaceae bacterium]|nr:STN domain-containing protein [Elusimicrobiaceae bacterium]
MKNRLAVVLALVATLGLANMAVAQNRQSLPSDNTITVVEDPSVRLSGETELYKESEGPSPLDRKVSIRVSNVPISVFLNSITTQAKINFIMSEEFANKKVTASLTRVTVREALDTLLRVHGLAYPRTA